jgi:hypothetical protein
MWFDQDATLVAPGTAINNGLYVDGIGATVSDVAYGGDYTLTDLVDAGATGRAFELSGARMNWLLDAAGVPAGLRDISTDTATYLGPSSAGGNFGDLCGQVAAAEAGRWFVTGAGVLTFRSHLWSHTAAAATTSQGTFNDSAADVVISPADRAEVVNEVTVSLPNGTSGTARDEESIALYGVRSRSYSAPVASPEAAAGLAAYYVGLRAHPRMRCTSVTFDPRTAPSTLWPHMLGRKIGDRITVIRNPTATLTPASTTEPITMPVTIEGISRSFSAEGVCRVTWTTIPAPATSAEAGWFTLDDAVLGMLDAGISIMP